MKKEHVVLMLVFIVLALIVLIGIGIFRPEKNNGL